MTPSNSSKIWFALLLPVILLLACSLRGTPTPPPPPTEALQPVQFSAAAPATPAPSPDLSVLLTATATATFAPSATPLPASPPPIATETPAPPPTATPEPPPTPTPPPPSATPESPSAEAPAPEPATDFVVRLVHMRTNAENSWDGVLNGTCGSDHSIYVHVVDAQENLLDGVLVGDKYGNFEVPTGVDGPGVVRILVWSATMELAVTGGPDGARTTSEFTPPLSTLDEAIPLDWLQAGGYCESAEDCRQRVESNQLCRGHYSYDVVFQRTW